MSDDRDPRVLEVAGAVADGAPVDWGATAPDPSDEAALTRLHVLESVAAAYRAAREGAAVEEGPELDPESSSTQGQVLFTWGHLQVLEKLGEGSFGAVYRAFDPALERNVALKLRRPEQTAGIIGRRAMLDEARRLARVRHPNVLTVHGADVHDGRVGLWADLITGQTLEERLQQDGPMGAREAALAGIELCDALAAVHAQGLTHGDVKAANIMRERGGRLVLMDFGSVTEVPRDGIGSPSALGTPLVAAPEVLRGETPTPLADLYSVGVLLYRLVSGRYPVEAQTLAELLEKSERGEAVPLADRRSDLPTAFLEVVERALMPTAGARYASAGAMRQALSASLGQAAAAGHAAAGASAGAASHVPHRGHSRRLLTALVSVLALAVPLALYLHQRRVPDPGSSAAVPAIPLYLESTLYREVGGRAQAVPSGTTVVPGDRLFLDVESREPVHVYVLNEDERGHRYVLFPLAGLDLANPLPAGLRHRLPGRRSGLQQAWEVSSAGGREAFLVVACRQALPELEHELPAFQAADPARRPERPAAAAGSDALRGIGGLTSSSAAADGAPLSLQRLAATLAARQQADGSVWVQSLELTNPGG